MELIKSSVHKPKIFWYFKIHINLYSFIRIVNVKTIETNKNLPKISFSGIVGNISIPFPYQKNMNKQQLCF